MTDKPAAAKRIVLDLLVTWGATARPGMSELFAELDSFRGRDRLAILPRILDMPGIDQGTELHGEILALVEASRGGDSLDSTFETRVDRVLSRAVPALRSSLDERRESLKADLAGWTRVLAPAERDPILERYWINVEESDLPSLMTALNSLGGVRVMLDRAREQTEAEIRSMLDSSGATAGDASAVEQARAALTSGDPLELLTARRALTTIKAREEHGRTVEELEAARQRLTDLCQRGRQILESADGALDGAARGILETTVPASEELVLASTETDSSAQVTAWTRSIAMREASLGAMLDSLAAGGPVTAEQQRAVAEAVAGQLNRMAPDDAAARQQAGALLEAAATRGPEFYQTLDRATQWIDARQAESTKERSAAEQEVRSAAGRLAAVLEASAATLPAERIVGARVQIEESEEAIAGGDPEAMRSLGGRMDKEAKELRQLAERAEEYLSSRENAERKRIAGEAARLEALAQGAEAKKLGALVAKAGRAGPDELGELDVAVRAAKAKVGNRIRVQAAGLAKRADQRLKRKGDKARATDLEKAAAALGTAREEDDLQAMAECSATLKGLLPKFGGAAFYGGLGALAVVVMVGAFFVWKSFAVDSHPYELTVIADENTVGETTLMLVQDGEIFAQESYRAGQPAGFELPDGRYEVYVNGRYTGVVIQVPGDPPQVTGIPYPR